MNGFLYDVVTNMTAATILGGGYWIIKLAWEKGKDEISIATAKKMKQRANRKKS